MTRYWVSWWSGNYADEGCTAPPFQIWDSGSRDRNHNSERDDVSICAALDAPDEDAIWAAVARHYPDFEPRFCNETAPDWQPNDRSPGFRGATSLEAGDGG